MDCSPFAVTLTNSDGTQIDTDLFEDDREWAPDFLFKVLPTSRLEAVGTYFFALTIKLGDGDEQAQTVPFEVRVIDPCDEPVGLFQP